MESAMTKATVKKERDSIDSFSLNDVMMKTAAIKEGKKLASPALR